MNVLHRAMWLSLAGTLSVLAQTPTISAVDNGFSFKATLSPGVLATVFGSNLTGNSLEVLVKGQSAPVTFSSATQLNIQIPWDVADGKTSVVVKHDGLTSAPFSVTISEYSPALVSDNGTGSGLGVFYSGANLITTTNPANAGDTLLTYAVGLGGTNPAIGTGVDTPNPPPYYYTLVEPSITVGGKAAAVLFSGLAPLALATDQLNFTLATNTPVGTETVVLKIGTATTNLINVPIGCLDSSSGVSVTLGPLNHPSSGKYTQKATITNVSGTQLQAKGSLILTGLTTTATLTNGGGTSCPSSDGSAFKSFTFTGTGSAQTASVTLDFTDTTSGSITYGTRVLTK